MQRVNDKHADELLGLARSLGGHPEAVEIRAEHVDAYGIDLLLTTPSGPVEIRIDFTEPVTDPRWMRAAFRDLTRRAQAASATGGEESPAPTSAPER